MLLTIFLGIITHDCRAHSCSTICLILLITRNNVAPTIEIINNSRGGIEGKIGEPGCSLIHDVLDKKVVLDRFFYFLNCFSL